MPEHVSLESGQPRISLLFYNRFGIAYILMTVNPHPGVPREYRVLLDAYRVSAVFHGGENGCPRSAERIEHQTTGGTNQLNQMLHEFEGFECRVRFQMVKTFLSVLMRITLGAEQVHLAGLYTAKNTLRTRRFALINDTLNIFSFIERASTYRDRAADPESSRA